MHKFAVSSNLYYSSLFLPQDKKNAISNIYDFYTEIENIIYTCSDTAIAQQKLVWWSNEIDRIFNGLPQHPIGKNLALTVKKFELPRLWFDEILQGIAMDLRYQGYETFADLKLYCHCTTSTVNMLMATIYGYKNQTTLEYAKQLGIAVKIVKIITNIGKDARYNRIYIPEDYMAAAHITPTEILNLQISDSKKFCNLMSKIAILARDYYNKAIQQLPQEDREAQVGGIIMAKIYFRILTEVENTNFNVMHQKITITPLHKLWIAWLSHWQYTG